LPIHQITKLIQFKDDTLGYVTHYKLLGHGHEYRRPTEVKKNEDRGEDYDLKRKVNRDNPCLYTEQNLHPSEYKLHPTPPGPPIS
jgi:hypothetical protein